jgi:glycosyltransferase involved in cell wall biosynthesis
LTLETTWVSHWGVFAENDLHVKGTGVKIAIVQREDARDVAHHSGVYYFMAKALEKHVGEVVYIRPRGSLLTKAIETAGQVLNRIIYKLCGRRISSDHHPILSKYLARRFGPSLAQCGCDVIFAPNASVEIASLSTDIPIIYRTDMNWDDMVDYYPGSKSLFTFARAFGEHIEEAAISKASALVYPSSWAARTASEHYKADLGKVYCIPSGANLEQEDVPGRDAALKHSLDHGIALLWVGVDWGRKGGPVAYDCLMALLNRGLDARMAVCGCVPPERFRHPKIEVIPFLSKRDPRQRRKLSQLFLDSSFFLFPTIAEAFGIVLCEASAFGLPSLACDTGGVRGAVTDRENGYLLPPDATGEQYAEKILETVRDRRVYNNLVMTCRKAYEDRLNWDAWGRAVKPIFEQVAKERATAAASVQQS